MAGTVQCNKTITKWNSSTNLTNQAENKPDFENWWTKVHCQGNEYHSLTRAEYQAGRGGPEGDTEGGGHLTEKAMKTR